MATEVTDSASVSIAIEPSIGRAFAATGSGLIQILDAATGAEMGLLDFAAGAGGYSPRQKIIAAGDRIYVLGTKPGSVARLFVLRWRRA